MQHLCSRMCYCLFVCDVQDSELDVAFQATFSKISPFIPADKARPHFTRLTAMWLHASFKTGLTHGHWSPRWMGKRSTFKLLMSSGDTRVLILRSVISGDHTLTQSQLPDRQLCYAALSLKLLHQQWQKFHCVCLVKDRPLNLLRTHSSLAHLENEASPDPDGGSKVHPPPQEE